MAISLHLQLLVIALWFVTLRPTLVMYTTCIASENAFYTGTVWFVYCVSQITRVNNFLPCSLLAGLIAALSIYVRSTTILLMIIIPVSTLIYKRGWRTTIASSLIASVIALVLLGRWSLRNKKYFNTYSPLSLNGSSIFWMGNHKGSSGSYTPLPAEVRNLPLVERERVLAKRARSFVINNPIEYAKLTVIITITTLRSDSIAVVWNEMGIRKRFGAWPIIPLKMISGFVHWLLLIVTFLSILSLGRNLRSNEVDTSSKGVIICLLSALLLSVPFVFIVAGNRYHLNLIPFTALITSLWLLRFSGEMKASS